MVAWRWFSTRELRVEWECNLESHAINDMAHPSQFLVLVSRSSIDEDSQARKGARKGFGCHPDSIWKRTDGIEVDGIL